MQQRQGPQRSSGPRRNALPTSPPAWVRPSGRSRPHALREGRRKTSQQRLGEWLVSVTAEPNEQPALSSAREEQDRAFGPRSTPSLVSSAYVIGDCVAPR